MRSGEASGVRVYSILCSGRLWVVESSLLDHLEWARRTRGGNIAYFPSLFRDREGFTLLVE